MKNDNLENLSDNILNELFDSEVTGLERKETEFVDIESRSISIYPPVDYCKTPHLIIPYLEKWTENGKSIKIFYEGDRWEVRLYNYKLYIKGHSSDITFCRAVIIALIKAKRNL